MSRRWAWIGLAGYALLLALGTLGPAPSDLFQWVAQGADRVDGFESVTYESVELGANVLVFIPVGLLLSAALPRWSGWSVWGACTAASAAVELLQMALPGRHATLLDVVVNSVGAGIGVLLFTAIAHRASRRHRPGDGAPTGSGPGAGSLSSDGS